MNPAVLRHFNMPSYVFVPLISLPASRAQVPVFNNELFFLKDMLI